MYCNKCGAQLADEAVYCPNCGQPTGRPVDARPYGPTPFAPALPMNWFKFLIYFSLFASAFFSLLNAAVMLAGLFLPKISIGLYYTVFPGLKPFYIVLSVLSVAQAAFAVYTRFQLSAYRKKAPLLLHIFFGVSSACGVISSLGTTLLTGGALQEISQMISSLIGGVVLIALNSIYFKKRAALFVN